MHIDQTGFIKGRYLKNNIRRVINIVNKAQSEDTPRVLLFLDAEKAFDLIEWQYLQRVVEKLGIGEFFSGWLQILYKDKLTITEVDEQKSEIIRLNRGVRQGCPLSPFLLALAIEPLAITIQSIVCR